MNWYKKQLIKIADSCMSNKIDDIRLLSDMLHSDFNICISNNEIKNVLEKIAGQNKKNSSPMDEVISDFASNLTDQDKIKLKDILVRYSQI